jgi:hypothetical protein
MANGTGNQFKSSADLNSGFQLDAQGSITGAQVGNRVIDYNEFLKRYGGQPQEGGFQQVAIPEVSGAPTVLDMTQTTMQPKPFALSEGTTIDDRIAAFEAGTEPVNNVGAFEIVQNTALSPEEVIQAETVLGEFGVDSSQMTPVQKIQEANNLMSPEAIQQRNLAAGIGQEDLLAVDAADEAFGVPGEVADVGGAGGVGTEPTFFQKMFGFYDKENRVMNKGFFEPVVGGALGVGRLALGFKQFEQAGEALDFQKDAFERNFAMQTEMINRRLEDRERARQLLQGNRQGADEAARKYVDKYGVKDKK